MNRIVKELRRHIPFTAFGALTGIILMILFHNMSYEKAHRLFYFFHPLHVVLSAIVTSAMFKRYKCGPESKCSFLPVLLVGYFGSIGIATLSDSIIPYTGEWFLRLPDLQWHIGFIEEFWTVNLSAVTGVLIGYFWPHTKFPHAGHVLLSTWASLFHVIMALGSGITVAIYAGVFVFLFLSVWVPCCVSDIVFPLLFVKNCNSEDDHGCCGY